MKWLPKFASALLCYGVLASAAVSSAQFTSPADLHGKSIAVATGSAQEAFVRKAYPDSTLLQYQNIPDTVMAVTSGKADASIMSTATADAAKAFKAAMGKVCCSGVEIENTF